MGNHAVDQSVAFGSGGIESIAEQEQLEGASHAHNSGQQITGPHIGSGQAYLREEEGKAGCLGGDAQIGGQGKNSSGSRGRTIEGGNDGLIQQPHVLYDGSSHAGEFQVSLHVALEQLTDNLVNIAAGTKVIPGSGQHDGAYSSIIAQGFK